MTVSSFRVGMGQMLVVAGDLAGNLERARRMMERAADDGCRVAVLPECLDCGWTWPGARQSAVAIPGPHSDAIADAARRHGLYVAAGLVERNGERLYNAAILVSPQGELLAVHRKINELDIARDLYATGDRLGVVRTPIGCLGMNICADNFPGSLALGHSLGLMGCRVLLSPCAWAVDAGHDNQREPYGDLWRSSYGELARQEWMYVIGVSNVGWLDEGPWAGRKCIGASLAVAPGGIVLAQGPYGVDAGALVTVEVQISGSLPEPPEPRGAGG